MDCVPAPSSPTRNPAAAPCADSSTAAPSYSSATAAAAAGPAEFSGASSAADITSTISSSSNTNSSAASCGALPAAVDRLAMLFSKAEADLTYVARKLDTEFGYAYADAGLESVSLANFSLNPALPHAHLPPSLSLSLSPTQHAQRQLNPLQAQKKLEDLRKEIAELKVLSATVASEKQVGNWAAPHSSLNCSP